MSDKCLLPLQNSSTFDLGRFFFSPPFKSGPREMFPHINTAKYKLGFKK